MQTKAVLSIWNDNSYFYVVVDILLIWIFYMGTYYMFWVFEPELKTNIIW